MEEEMAPQPQRKPSAAVQAQAAVTEAEKELTPEQRQIRELQDQLAKTQAALMDKEDKAEVEQLSASRRVHATDNSGAVSIDKIPTEVSKQGNILIHFIEDGFTALGVVWVRGQEIEFDPESEAYAQTKDRNGDSWVRWDEAEQMRRKGRVYFRPGPWVGKSYLDGKFEALKALAAENQVDMPSREELDRAQRAEIARRRAAPVLPSFGSGTSS